MATKDIGDITAGELLELLADDEMIESGYDREGMVALLLLARAALQVLCGQIDELQAGQQAAIDDALRQQARECCVGQTERPLCLCTPTPVDEPRQTCGSCEHWRRGDEPATEAGARPCGLDEEPDPAPRHPGSSCGWPGSYRALGTAKTDPAPESDSPPLKGVTRPADNVIQSRGDDDV